jgi:acetate kinase
VADAILVLNAGSSSLKFALFEGADLGPLARGQVSGIGTSPRLELNDEMRELPDSTDHLAALKLLFEHFRNEHITAAGHRVVHGGMATGPMRIDGESLQQIESLVPLAPLHQPQNLAVIQAMRSIAPDLPQVACFDTAFHRTQPALAQQFGLPRRFTDEGVIRYGFHGLSYEYIASELHSPGRTIVAHLGNGASLCALRDGRSMATTMSFTPADGLLMGTRCGSLDPGVLLYLLTHRGMTVDEVERLINHESGLLGISGISSDMRALLASSDPRAAEAIDIFVYRISREIGSLAAALGGLDTLIFTGGIGENAERIRDRVRRDAAWLGAFDLRVIPTNEELMIARHVRATLAGFQP